MQKLMLMLPLAIIMVEEESRSSDCKYENTMIKFVHSGSSEPHTLEALSPRHSKLKPLNQC